MIEFKTLKFLTIKELVSVFNAAFHNYYVPILLTQESLQNKIHTEDIDLNLSVGAFQDDELIGFILHGVRNINGEVVAYNAGTGVLPAFRGNQLAEQMFSYIKPFLLAANVKRIYLEVIEENSRAKKVYTKLGFAETRSLLCFKNSIAPETLTVIPWGIINERRTFFPQNSENFFDWQPAWQNHIETVKKLKTSKTYTIENTNGEVFSFVTINELTSRIVLFATAKPFRKKGYAGLLFYFITQQYKNGLSIINIDADDEVCIEFLKRNGFSNYLRQYEMIKTLEST